MIQPERDRLPQGSGSMPIRLVRVPGAAKALLDTQSWVPDAADLQISSSCPEENVKTILQLRQLFLLILAGWVSRRQQDAIDYLLTIDNRVFREKLGTKRILLVPLVSSEAAVYFRLEATECQAVTGRLIFFTIGGRDKTRPCQKYRQPASSRPTIALTGK
jgi:hypothetical protein